MLNHRGHATLPALFNLDAELRPALRRRLRDLAESGQLTKQNQNPARQVEALAETTMPEISVLEILGFDDDGNGYARRVDDDAADVNICVLRSRREGRAPAIGQQILARLTQIGPGHYEARIIRVLDRQPKHIFGIAIATKNTSDKNIGQKFCLETSNARQTRPAKFSGPEGMNITDGDLVEAILQSGVSALTNQHGSSPILATARNQARLARWHLPSLTSDMNFLKLHFEKQKR